MTSLPEQPITFRFPGWELRPTERLLLVQEQTVPVGSRAFDVLWVLVQRQGELVTKDQLLDLAWSGLVVEENNVSVQIAALRKVLGPHVIATVPGRGYRLIAVPEGATAAADLRADGPSTAAWSAQPAAPNLLGRESDQHALAVRIGAAPLVSIVGAGGIGKTSLAKAMLAAHYGAWPDGVHWIELAPEHDGSQLEALVAKALGVDLGGAADTRETLVAAMSPLRALITVDNCEHVHADVARFVRRALDRAPGVRWLATSQRPLRVAGEWVHRLDPLDVPEPEATLAEAEACGAVALLCRCAAAADRRFALTQDNLRMAIDLCRQLDGLPLAIEMAAARIATLGLRGVHERLGQRLRLLAGPQDSVARQQTLHSALDWSHGLLAPGEQKVFRRLEPFLGGFTAEMAQAVVADPAGSADALDEWQVLDALSTLVDISLVQRGTGYPQRFFLLESAHAYARERLAEHGETAILQRRHAQAVAATFNSARAAAERLRDDEWMAIYVPERFNVRAALNWACTAREPDLLARLVAAMAQIDAFLGGRAEVVHTPLPMDVLEQAEPALRAAACMFASWAHHTDGNRELGAALAQRAHADFMAVGDSAGAYRALAQLIRLYESRPGTLALAKQAWQQLAQIDRRRLPTRTRLFCTISAGLQYESEGIAHRPEELEDMARHAGFDGLAATCRVHIVDELLIQGQFEAAADTARRYLDATPMRPRTRARMLMNQTLALVELGRVHEAFAPARLALRAHPSDAPKVIDLLALAAAKLGRYPEAALMAGFGAKTRQDKAEKSDPAEAAVIAKTWALLGERLSPQRLEELARIGAEMPLAELLVIALPPDNGPA